MARSAGSAGSPSRGCWAGITPREGCTPLGRVKSSGPTVATPASCTEARQVPGKVIPMGLSSTGLPASESSGPVSGQRTCSRIRRHAHLPASRHRRGAPARGHRRRRAGHLASGKSPSCSRSRSGRRSSRCANDTPHLGLTVTTWPTATEREGVRVSAGPGCEDGSPRPAVYLCRRCVS